MDGPTFDYAIGLCELMSPKLGPGSPDVGFFRPRLGLVRPNWGVVRPRPDHTWTGSAGDLAKFGPVRLNSEWFRRSQDRLVQFGAFRGTLGWILCHWTKLGRGSAKLGSVSVSVGPRIRPFFVPASANFGPDLAKLGRVGPKLGSVRPTFGLGSARSSATRSGSVRPNLDRFADFGVGFDREFRPYSGPV